MDNEEVVCGASSYMVYNQGIEIEIDTKEEYQILGESHIIDTIFV